LVKKAVYWQEGLVRSGLLHHKINCAMAARDNVHQLEGVVQVDDAYLGGERAGGKPGRGSENKVSFFSGRTLYLGVRVDVFDASEFGVKA